jgi:hypothetical protein
MEMNHVKSEASHGWGCTSVEEPLPSKCKAMNSIPSIEKKGKEGSKQGRKEGRKKTPILYNQVTVTCHHFEFCCNHG